MLPETPTTGYRWRPEPTDTAITLAGAQPVQTDPELGERVYGGQRSRHLWWRALEPSSATVAAELRRSFGAEETVDRFEINLRVQPARTGQADHGLSRRQLAIS
jgi:predicted secreted protein